MDDNEEEQTELREDAETDFINEEDLQEVPVENIPADGLNEVLEDLVMEDELGENEATGGEDTSQPLRDDAICCFSGHNGGVFFVSVHPTEGLACSGGEDDKAFVWRVTDGTVAFECHGHKDSVTCTQFSHDGKYVATADMGGLVQVWLATTGELVWSFETDDIEWLKWHPGAHVLLVGTTEGNGWMWKIPSGDCKTFQGHGSVNSCAAILNDGKRAAFGYGDGAIKVWSLKEGVPLVSVASPQKHTASVTCLAAHADNTILLSGSEDGTAKLINSNTGKVLTTFGAGFPKSQSSGAGGGGDEESESEPPSVEAIAFSPVLPIAVTGSLSGVLGVWDMPTQKLRQRCNHDVGVVRLYCSKQAPVVFTGCLDGVVRGWDLRSGQCIREWQGHSDHILDMTVSRDENHILSAANDGTVRVFKT